MFKVVPRQPFVDQPHATASPLHDDHSEFDIEAHSLEYDMVARLAGPVVIVHPLKECLPWASSEGFQLLVGSKSRPWLGACPQGDASQYEGLINCSDAR